METIIITLTATGANMTALLAAHQAALADFLDGAPGAAVEMTGNGEVRTLPPVVTPGDPDNPGDPGTSTPGGYGSARQYTIRVAAPDTLEG